eukprot:CAMPEP_0180786224 /NCGR_PEP_ID=MMETSP1038_2-20121128/50679_1 /TAXON_ID=632150 /ORGANISM="Azadinium spinosum, Strain 3D9" /LENGTH=34 /DNA_ID= /DNA_START= /DNA_END= /DNA_ORIENTATION=
MMGATDAKKAIGQTDRAEHSSVQLLVPWKRSSLM